jgi:chromosome segregation ATPase
MSTTELSQQLQKMETALKEADTRVEMESANVIELEHLLERLKGKIGDILLEGKDPSKTELKIVETENALTRARALLAALKKSSVGPLVDNIAVLRAQIDKEEMQALKDGVEAALKNWSEAFIPFANATNDLQGDLDRWLSRSGGGDYKVPYGLQGYGSNFSFLRLFQLVNSPEGADLLKRIKA